MLIGDGQLVAQQGRESCSNLRFSNWNNTFKLFVLVGIQNLFAKGFLYELSI